MCFLFITFNSCDTEEKVIESQEFIQVELQESEEFKTFMTFQTGWKLKHVFSRIIKDEKNVAQKMSEFKTYFQENGIPDLDSKKMKEFMSYFNFSDSKEFGQYFNLYNESISDLLDKFPQIKQEENIFINAQEVYLSNFKAEEIFGSFQNLKNDTPENVFTTIEMPKCHWSQEYAENPEVGCFGLVPKLEVVKTNKDDPDFSNCDGFIANNCQSVYNQCVIDEQFDYINRLIDCFGEEFIYYDIADILDGECYWTFAQEGQESEYVCPGNEPGTGGFDIVISLIEGFTSGPSGTTISEEECFECIVDDYYSIVCAKCVNVTRAECCD